MKDETVSYAKTWLIGFTWGAFLLGAAITMFWTWAYSVAGGCWCVTSNVRAFSGHAWREPQKDDRMGALQRCISRDAAEIEAHIKGATE